MSTLSANERIWESRKLKLQSVVEDFAARSEVMLVRGVRDWGYELRWAVEFSVKTLVRPPGQAVRLEGPVVTGIRYHRDFLAAAPVPWEIVTVLEPGWIFHPNVHPVSGGLCLGHPMPGISMEQILHTVWAALVFNMRLVNTVDWQGLNSAAAQYVREHGATQFPLTRRGLLERSDPKPLEKTS